MAQRKKIILTIDTSSNEEIKVGLEVDKKAYLIKSPIDKQKAQVVLPMIEKLLSKYKLKLKDITEIKVHPGPGSFTGLRVGISIANTLGFLLKIPINGKRVGKLVEPKYG